MARPNHRRNAGDAGMKRRDFFAAAGASAVALTTLPRGLAAQSDSAAVAAEQYEVGDFVLRRGGPNLSVVHRGAPERLLWESEPDGNFLVLRTGRG